MIDCLTDCLECKDTCRKAPGRNPCKYLTEPTILTYLINLLTGELLAELRIAGEFLRAELPRGDRLRGLAHFLILIAER